MTMDQLDRFLAVAEYRNFTRAAEALYITPSTLSKDIANLEESLGVRLLLRNSKRVELTESGALLRLEGRELSDHYRRLCNQVRMSAQQSCGRLCVYSLNMESEPFFELYQNFSRQHPQNSVALYFVDFGMSSRAVEQQECDLGLSFSFELEGKEDAFECVHLDQKGLCIVTSPEHPLARFDVVTQKDIENEQILFFDHGASGHAKWQDGYTNLNKIPTSGIPLETQETMLMEIKAGHGIGLLPIPIARLVCAGLSQIPLQGVPIEFDIVLFWRNNNPNPALCQFLKLLTQMHDHNDRSNRNP